MTHEGRQCRQSSPHVILGAIPIDQGGNGEGVAKTMWPGPALLDVGSGSRPAARAKMTKVALSAL